MKLQNKYGALLFIIALCFLQPAFANNTRLLIHTKPDFILSNKEIDLVLYFPGYGCWSKFLLLEHKHGGLELTPPVTKYRPNIVFATFDTDPLSHFGSQKVVFSVLKDILKLTKIYKIKKIFLVGGSMGSSLALNLASLAEGEIKDKISGILVYFPITNYEQTMKNTKNKEFKDALVKHFTKDSNDPDLAKHSSPITFVKDLPQKAKTILIVGTEDTTAPPEQAKIYFQEAKDFGKNIYLHTVKANHKTEEISVLLENKLKELLR